MSRSIALAAALALVSSGTGCSLIWTPVVGDAGAPEPPIDADLDAGVDAYVMPPPIERCANDQDDDDDDLADCADPDCFGAEDCCAGPASGGAVLDWNLLSPTDRNDQGGATVRGSTDAQLDLGSGGAIRRQLCVPLAQGGEIELSWTRSASTEATLSLVLSPSPFRGPSGYLDELALRIDERNRAYVTAGGMVVPLATPPTECPALEAGRLQLPPSATARIVLQPSVHLGRPALLATIRIQATFNASCSAATLVADHPIPVDQLVRSTEGPRSCDETPGLWLALDGARTAFVVQRRGDDEHVRIRNYQCAAPGAFSPGRVALGYDDFAGAPAELAGGVAAPDLSGATSRWFLAVDGSSQDRNTERLAGLDLRAVVGTASSADAERWTPIGTPTFVLPPNAREPSYNFTLGQVVFSTAESRAVLGYSIAYAQEYTAFRGRFAAPTVLLEPDDDCRSLREPTLVPTPVAGTPLWLLYRCDDGSESTLGMVDTQDMGVRVNDVLAGDPIASRVIAADVVTRDQDTRRYWALWVLAQDTGGRQALHLFVAEAPLVMRPSFVAYEGNPVLRSTDPTLCGDDPDCRITSFTVAHVVEPAARDRLRFLFARSWFSGGAPVHDLVPLEQPASTGIEPL